MKNHDPFNDGAVETEERRGGLSRRSALLAAAGVASLAAAPEVAAQPISERSPTADTGRVRLVVNGRQHELDLDTRQSLLDVLRETLDLTGTKKGCNQGACGACTVLLNGRRIVSCLTLAAMHDGAEIETIEGLANGRRASPAPEQHSSSTTACSAASAPRARSCPASAASRKAMRVRPRRSGSG